MTRANRSSKRPRAPSCLRCHRYTNWLCVLVLILGVTHCQRWVRVYAASQMHEETIKLRTLPQHLLYSQGRENHATRVSSQFASEAPPGHEAQFEENQSKLPVLLALVLVCGGLVLRQDAIAIFGVYQFCCVMTSQSILESFHVLSRASFDALELYSEFALMTPVLAKSLTSGVAYIMGDMIAQILEGSSVIDFIRCGHNALAGMVLHGPLLHYWILLLEGPFSGFFWNPEGWRCTVVKVALDQTVFSGFLNAAYAIVLGLLARRKLKETFHDLRRTLPAAMWSSWRFWPFVHLVTYSPIMPIQLKVLWNDLAEVAWVAILSLIANANNNSSKCTDKDLAVETVVRTV